jgi:cytochrome c
MDNKTVGPAILDIAAEYKGDDAAPAALAAKVKNGGSGVWGEVPMPPNAAISDEDINKFVAWMLSQ